MVGSRTATSRFASIQSVEIETIQEDRALSTSASERYVHFGRNEDKASSAGNNGRSAEVANQDFSPRRGTKSSAPLSRQVVETCSRLPAERFWRQFWSRVDKSGDCWLWTGAKNKHGYGILKFGSPRKNFLAHRIAFVFDGREIPAGADLLHGDCNNPACVRHTRIGTQAENNRDTSARGRHVAANQHFTSRVA